MRYGTPLEWSELLGVGPDDLPAATGRLVQGVEVLDDTVVQLRTILHDSPDRGLDEALMQLERRAREVVDLVRDLHHQAIQELA